MTKTQWTTSAQRAWLEGLMPGFVQAQLGKTTSTIFFPTMFTAWTKEFPLDPVTELEITQATGQTTEEKEVKATADKTKRLQKVSMPSSDFISLTQYVHQAHHLLVS